MSRRLPCREPGPHHFTLLDGEMVVDEDMVADKRIRRYLAYDLVLDNNRNMSQLPFSVRSQPAWSLSDSVLSRKQRRHGLLLCVLRGSCEVQRGQLREQPVGGPCRYCGVQRPMLRVRRHSRADPARPMSL